MARCPFAQWVPAGTPGGPIKPRVLILHTEATAGKARPHSGLEWHFWIANDGTIDQLVDTNLRADANNKANSFAISVETEDDGSPNEDPWTPAQVASILRLCLWANQVHGIPLRRCDGPFGSGIGNHTMWGAPSDWTPVVKSCPGAARKAQFDAEIIPALTGSPIAAAPPSVDVPPTAPVLTMPTIKRGTKGAAVRRLQDLLVLAGHGGYGFKIDGAFGGITLQRVKNFQRERGLVPDGIVGPKTWAVLLGQVTPGPSAPPAPTPVQAAPVVVEVPSLPVDRPTIRRGAKGGHVVYLQQRLHLHGRGGAGVSNFDGDFGQSVDRSVRQFQGDRGLAVDGIVGPNTWRELG